MKNCFLLFLILFSVTYFGRSQANAIEKQETATSFLEGCQAYINWDGASASIEIDAVYCTGFVGGYMLGFVHGKYGNKTCIPDRVTAEQLARIFIKFAKAHPEHLHLDKSTVFTAAIKDAFPCSSDQYEDEQTVP